jgi:hypothetical protein
LPAVLMIRGRLVISGSIKLVPKANELL